MKIGRSGMQEAVMGGQAEEGREGEQADRGEAIMAGGTEKAAGAGEERGGGKGELETRNGKLENGAAKPKARQAEVEIGNPKDGREGNGGGEGVKSMKVNRLAKGGRRTP